MQVVILAGGLGMRLRPLTERMPKCMVPVNGKPFLEYQLGLLAGRGMLDIVLCAGYLARRSLNTSAPAIAWACGSFIRGNAMGCWARLVP